VLTAASPSEALALARRHPGAIDLLITDIVLPEMNGRDLNRHLASLFPNLKVVFMSGYTANVIAHHGVLEQGVHFIQKPFSRKDLAVKIKEALVIRETMGKSGPGPRQTAG
jgi:YesN/AraC family two-component response regulator